MDKIVLKTCAVHGEQQHVLEGKYHRCKKCRYANVARRRAKLKVQLVEEFGGQCFKCGYSACYEALEFHHVNPESKSFGIASGKSLSYAAMKAEAEKCLLLCATCHREVESGFVTVVVH